MVISLYDDWYGVCIDSNAPILQKVLKEEEDDEKGEANTIAVALILICLFTPLWPAF